MRFKVEKIDKESTTAWDHGKIITWYYLYVKKYWFSIIWRKCGYGDLHESDTVERRSKYESGEYPIPDLAVTKWIKSLPKTFRSTILCIKYPFLWPRNRFTGLHHNSWKFDEYIKSVYKKAYRYVGKPGDESDPFRKETNKFYAVWYNIINWINENPFQWLFCIPTYTELDAMPDGWRKAFGLQMCEEIKQSLLNTGGRKMLKSYRITQIKEKFGNLRWYDAYTTDDIQRIINKYEYISEHVCITCGEPAKYRTTSWISPYCEKHLPNKDREFGTFKKI